MKAQAQAAEHASDASQAGALRRSQAPSAGESGQAGGMSAALDPAADFLLPGQLLSMQGVAGNAAVSRLVAARGNGVQRAPEAAAGLDPKARVDRLRLAIKQNFLVRQHLLVDIEAVASALGGMTTGEGRAVKVEYAKQTGWNLGWLLSGELEIEGKPVVTDVGPANRRRLLTLLAGTVAEPAVDPMAAMETGEKLGRFVGSFVGMEDELGAQAGAVAAVAARDQNLAAEAKASGARARTQAIELKVWLDKGQKEKIFSLLAKLATPAAADEKKALSDAYAGQFGEQLYTALTARLKGRDQERVIALWMEDTGTAERLALQADLEKLKKAEAQAEKFAPLAKSGIMAKTSKQIQQQRTDARAAVEGRLESIGQEGGDKLQAVLGEGTEGQAVAEQLGVGKDAVITALVRGDRPEALALRLARSDREGTLKAAEIEETLLELRQAAEGEASRQKAAAGREPGAPPLATAEVVNSYFARFQARFAAERPGRIFVQLLAGSVGNKIERERNTALLLQQGVLPEWQELYFAISSSRKDMERVRQILGTKTRSQIRELAEEYSTKTPGNRDLTVDLLGTIEERLLIEKPTADDYMRGRAPKDLAAAREVYEEKKRLLRGGTFEEESKPGGSEAALAQLAEELAADRARAPGKPGGPAVPAEIVGSLASMAASEGEVRRLREEAAWVFGRVSSIDTAVMENRGSFARVRDWSGNLEHELVMSARRDAADAHRAVDAALSQDPPDVEAARRSIGELHLIEARMTHNVGVYKQATEEAFNAFVDVAVMAVSMLASGGAAGAIMGAIRATAATIATKATLKGSAYGADEVWADIRGGVFSAGAGKLAEKLVPRLAAAYAAKAKAKGWDKGWAGAVSAKVEPAVMWEVENLISGGGAGLLEAGYQGDTDPLTESVGLTSHAMALGQHVATTPIRRRAERKREARRQADAAAAAAGRSTEELAPPQADVPVAGPTETEAGALKPALTAEAPLAAPPGGPSEQKPRPPVAGDTSTAPKPLSGGEGAAPAPPARPPGGPTDPIAAGVIPEGSAKTLQQLADEYDLVIKVRPMNPESIARLEPRRDAAGAIVEDAALPKPDIVKAKSINELDEYIGGPVNSRGLVGLFEPRSPSADLPPDLLAAATDRYQRRLKEWRTRDADYGRYQRDGILRIEGGLVQVVDPRLSSDSGADQGRFRNVAGDIDVYDITHADGSPLTDRQRNDLTVLLRSMGIGVEHGAHEWWRTQHPGSFKAEAYEGIRQEHLQKTPLIAFLPVAQPQSVWADSVVRTTPREDRPGQRIRPLRKQAGEQFSLVPREEAGRTSPDTPDTPDTPGQSPAGSAGETVSTPRPGPAGGGAGGGSTPSAPSTSGSGTRPTAGGPGTSQPLLPARAGSPSPGVGAEPFAATPVAPDPLAQTPRETLTQAEPGTPTLISQANLFRSGDARVPEGLAPAVEHITWDQWAHIETVGEGNNLKYILVDATTGERWMFKPAGGEEGMAFGPDLGIETGERWRRALAAAYLSQDLGLETPYVRLVEIDGMVGSLQEWRAGFEARSTIAGPAQANFDAFWNSRFRHDIDAFDYFIANQDRHERNVMIRMEGGRPRRLLIDQDAGMPPSPERFTAARPRDQLGRWQRDLPPSVSAEVAQRFRELAERFPDAQLRQWLTDAEVDGLWSRLNEVVDDLDSGRIGIVED